MRALVWSGLRQMSVQEVAEPVAEANEVIVSVAKAGICGSDLHAYRGEGGRRVPPLVLGHEAVGTIDGERDLVAIFPLVGCGICELCLSGMANLCEKRSLLGLDRPGTFAERVAVPRDCAIPVPDGLAPGLAALAEPLATSLAALDSRDIGGSSRLVVIGCGAIGLLALHYARLQGANVEVVDPVGRRREIALGLGASAAHGSVESLRAASADLVLDAVGIETTWCAALEALRPAGTVVVVGLGQQTGSVPVGTMVRSGLRLEGSYAYAREHFVRALEILASRPPDHEWLTEVTIDDSPSAFADLVDRPAKAVKVLINFGEDPA